MSEMSATGVFEIAMTPADALLPGSGRFDFTKTWTGDVDGTSNGVMLSAGDPGAGSAGYVALETFEGTIAGRRGTLAFQQLGMMQGGAAELRYEIVPGSGTGELAGHQGQIALDVVDGVHHVTLTLSTE